MIIFPDIHGRPFWRKPIENALKSPESIIFLGDYLDPYDYEGITPAEALSRFKEIVALKTAHPEQITLLLGNHDLHYLYWKLEGGRLDWLHKEEIKAFILENADCFQMAAAVRMPKGNILFSHAGILNGWLKKYPQIFTSMDGEIVASVLNEMWTDEVQREKLLKILSDVPFSRWGNSRYGSPVWSDVDDIRRDAKEIPGWYQIFGHSQQETSPVFTQHFACLDCRKAFRLDEDGNLTFI